MVVRDGQKWRRVNSRKIMGHWYEFRDLPDVEMKNMPDIFITIDGRVPKNMSGKGTDTFELWPIKHNGNYRYSGRYFYDYSNSYGHYYSVKQYTYWKGLLYSRTEYYTTDRQIKYLKERMKDLCELHKGREAPSGDSYYKPPFACPLDMPQYANKFVNARYSIK